MSMYPSPYQPPGVPQYYALPVDPLAAAKRASWMLFFIGPFMLLMGTCAAFISSFVQDGPRAGGRPDASTAAGAGTGQSRSNHDNRGNSGAGDWRCHRGAGIFRPPGRANSLHHGHLLMGLMVLNSLGGVVSGLAKANPPAVGMAVLMIGFFGLEIYFLIQAIRAAGNVRLAQQQYAAQYWQYQQTMQAYANAGYSYPTPLHSSKHKRRRYHRRLIHLSPDKWSSTASIFPGAVRL